MLVFEIVTVVVCVVSAVIAAVSFVRGLKLYDKIGQLGTFAMTHDEEPSAATRELVSEEVRQMLDALSEAHDRPGTDRPRPNSLTYLNGAPQSARSPIKAEVSRGRSYQRCPARPR
jgi:hypothetical protein